MEPPTAPGVIVYVCRNCVPGSGALPRQWTQGAMRCLVREVPCSGKIDVQYLVHALESGVDGLCVVTCPEGDCRLAQGNARAEVRIRTVRRLLTEIGIEPGRVELLRCSRDDPFELLEGRVRDALDRISALGDSPLREGRTDPTPSTISPFKSRAEDHDDEKNEIAPTDRIGRPHTHRRSVAS